MMKNSRRKMRIIFCTVLLLGMFFTNVTAKEGEIQETLQEIIYYEDGTYAEITGTEVDTGIMVAVNSSSKVYTKSYTRKTNSGTKLWRYWLKGSFTYNGTTSKATNVTDGYVLYRTNWKLTSKNCAKSGRKVTGYGIFTNGTKTRQTDLAISCNKDGEIS